MQIPLFRQIIIKKLRRSSRIFSAAPPEFLAFCFELFNENFQVRLLSPSCLPPAVYVITSQGEAYAQDQICDSRRNCSGIFRNELNRSSPIRMPAAGMLLLNISASSRAAQLNKTAAARLMPVRMSTAWPIVRSQEHPGRETCICAWKPSVPYMRKEGTAAEAKRRSTAHMAKAAAQQIPRSGA